MIEKEELQTLIPHRGKMLLLSKIIDYNLDERSLAAEYHITEDCLFFNSAAGGVSEEISEEQTYDKETGSYAPCKRKVIRKFLLPDIAAAKLLLGFEGAAERDPFEGMSDEELEKEKEKLLEELKDA
jgi:hypothetical protein